MILLIIFAVRQRAVCLSDGNLYAAGNCLKLGIFSTVFAFVLVVAMIWTWKRSRRAEKLLKEAKPKWASPIFEAWYVQEMKELERMFGKGRVIGLVAIVLIIFHMWPVVYLLLDDGMNAMTLFSMSVAICIIFLVYYITDYVRKYIRPLDASILRVLSDISSQENFAGQISGADRLTCMTGSAWISPDFCYVRQPGKSCIIKMAQIEKVILKRTMYAVGGLRHVHFSTCYVMEFFRDSHKRKPFWAMYFAKKEELDHAVSMFQITNLPQSKIQDEIRH